MLQDAFIEFGATGQRDGTSAFGMMLARSHLAGGDAARAAEVADGALAFAAETGERAYEAELHRVKGECFSASGARKDAKRSFERALAIAADRKALLFELRAATSLLRLRGKAVRERVVRLVECFGSEDDCADLRAARALLGQ